jgi:hypothetical protein
MSRRKKETRKEKERRRRMRGWMIECDAERRDTDWTP